MSLQVFIAYDVYIHVHTNDNIVLNKIKEILHGIYKARFQDLGQDSEKQGGNCGVCKAMETQETASGVGKLWSGNCCV